jgi:4-amino-4-deoxy-L-arabinose transferase-like glycosyltransferase
MLSVPARAALLGAFFAALVTLPGLGIGTLWDNSETAYGEVAREVLLTHDWVVMHLNGVPWFVQTPLYFWIAALLAKVFGVSAFAMRLPSALATIAMGGAVGYATARIAGGRAGTVAAIVLSTSLMQAIVGRLAIMDALLDFAVAAAALWWYRAFEPTGTVRRRDTAFVCGALALAIGTLAKGPVAPVVAALIIGAWMLWERRAGKLSSPHPYAFPIAALAFCVVALPWFVALIARVGLGGVVVLIGHYTVGRYTGVIENQTGPVWYYLPVVILGFFPWIAFLPVSLVAAWRDATKPEGAFTRFALVWAVVPFVFFSFANTKLPNYVALILPALAILVALWFERVPPGTVRRAAVVSAATVPIFIGCVALAIAVFARTNQLDVDTEAVGPELAFLGAAMLLGSLITVVTLARARTATWAPYVLAVTSGALVLFIAFVAVPVAETLKPIPPLAQQIEAQRRPGDAVGIHGVAGGNGLIFYTAPPVLDVKNAAVFGAMICSSNAMWIVTTPAEGDRLVQRAQSAGRQAEIVATAPRGNDPRAALMHVFGDPCRHDAALR